MRGRVDLEMSSDRTEDHPLRAPHDAGKAACWPGLLAGISVAASVVPLLLAVLVYPIDKGTVFVGPITLFTGPSLLAWVLTRVVGLGIALRTQFKRPFIRRRAWFALLAGEFFYVAGFMCLGAVVSRVLDGHWSVDFSSVLILSISVVGCALNTREALR